MAGAGVAILAQYAMGKLYNDPLLYMSISLVVNEDGKSQSSQSSSSYKQNNYVNNNNKESPSSASKAISVAISSVLLLAFDVGTIQLIFYFTFTGERMGVGPVSTM